MLTPISSTEVPATAQEKLPQGVEENVPNTIHDTGSAGSKSHATGDSKVPMAVQEAVPKKLEEVLPNKIHDTSPGGIDTVCVVFQRPMKERADRVVDEVDSLLLLSTRTGPDRSNWIENFR